MTEAQECVPAKARGSRRSWRRPSGAAGRAPLRLELARVKEELVDCTGGWAEG